VADWLRFTDHQKYFLLKQRDRSGAVSVMDADTIAKKGAAIIEDLETSKYFTLGGLQQQIASAGGVIDPSDKSFKDGVNSLLNADPKALNNAGRAVISLLATEEKARESIVELERSNVDPQITESLRKKILENRASLEESLKTESGIKDLLGDLLKRKYLEKTPFLKVLEKDEGMYKKGDAINLTTDESRDIARKLESHFKFPKEYDAVFSATSRGSLVNPEVSKIISDNMKAYFGKEVKGDIIFDPSKMTEQNMKEFGQKVEKDLSEFARVKQNLPLAKEILDASVEKAAGGSKVTDEVRKKIEDSLLQKLSGLDRDVLKSKKEELIAGIEQQLVKSQTLVSRITSKFDISSDSINRINVTSIANTKDYNKSCVKHIDNMKKLSENYEKNKVGLESGSEKLVSLQKDFALAMKNEIAGFDANLKVLEERNKSKSFFTRDDKQLENLKKAVLEPRLRNEFMSAQNEYNQLPNNTALKANKGIEMEEKYIKYKEHQLKGSEVSGEVAVKIKADIVAAKDSIASHKQLLNNLDKVNSEYKPKNDAVIAQIQGLAKEVQKLKPSIVGNISTQPAKASSVGSADPRESRRSERHSSRHEHRRSAKHSSDSVSTKVEPKNAFTDMLAKRKRESELGR
jgi:hypothetical protein